MNAATTIRGYATKLSQSSNTITVSFTDSARMATRRTSRADFADSLENHQKATYPSKATVPPRTEERRASNPPKPAATSPAATMATDCQAIAMRKELEVRMLCDGLDGKVLSNTLHLAKKWRINNAHEY
ncbi:MAG TPA: hypothetical protein VMC81_08630 [Rhodocyclaceae bacterium]|nr:hypothetical protein [Rhodocyclaceae bacterium]